MEVNKIIEEEITNTCHENYHADNINYYCKNHNDFFCKNCIQKKENCKILEFKAFQDEQKSQIQDNIKNLEKNSKIIEENYYKLKNIYEQIKNSMNNLINDINLVFSCLIDELINKKEQLLVFAKNKFDIKLFKNTLLKYESLNNDIKLLIKKEEIFKTKWSNNSNINDCTSIKYNINEMKLMNYNIKQNILSMTKNVQNLKEEKNKFNLLLTKIESYYKDFKNNNKETYKIFNALLETLVFLENKLDTKQIKKNPELDDKDINYLIKTSNIKANNFFTSKDIQIKLNEIFDYFKIYSNNFFDDNEEIENQKIGEFLLKVANISRISYNLSNVILKSIYDNFIKSEDNYFKKKITSPEEIKKDFSSWAKNNIIDIENKISDYLNNIEILYIKEEDYNNKNFFNKLIKDLSILFFKCELSFPSIQINFNLTEDIFNYEKMVDYAHNKGKKKVNFVFFPSFESNNNYLDNGKQWVFTYKDDKKKTFYFKEIKLEPLIKNKFKIPKLSNKLELDIKIVRKKHIIPILNYTISDRAKREFIYYFKNNKDNKTIKFVTDKEVTIEEYLDFIKCDFYLMSEYILSYPKNN